MAAGAQNGFNQAVWSGIQAQARREGDVDVRLFDGGFDSTLQYNQIEDVIASKRFDGLIVFPNDSVSIASAVGKAHQAGLTTVAVQFPIGANLGSITPQTDGVAATVAAPPAAGAALQAETVAQYCRSKPTCRVVVVIGQKIYPFDMIRYGAYLKVLGGYPNIKVVATIEGDYDASTSMAGMLDVLQAHRRIDAVISSADIQTMGVEMALKSYGIDPSSVYLMGSGGSQLAVTAIRQGRWAATYASVPATMGAEALATLDAALAHRAIKPAIDADRLTPLQPIWTKDLLRAHPALRAEWAG
jgi:ribose transport system substrate-binding protein